MVIDRIENYKLYSGLGQRISKALEYISQTDFNQMEAGKYLVDSDNIFALVQDYETKDKRLCKLERHFKYLDIQYILDGSELMGLATLSGQTPVESKEVNDVAFYKVETSMVKFEKGMFAIFFPDDLHMPGVQLEFPAKVRKVVMKVRL